MKKLKSECDIDPNRIEDIDFLRVERIYKKTIVTIIISNQRCFLVIENTFFGWLFLNELFWLTPLPENYLSVKYGGFQKGSVMELLTYCT